MWNALHVNVLIIHPLPMFGEEKGIVCIICIVCMLYSMCRNALYACYSMCQNALYACCICVENFNKMFEIASRYIFTGTHHMNVW